jgi:hypothetical protein
MYPDTYKPLKIGFFRLNRMCSKSKKAPQYGAFSKGDGKY